MARFFKWLIIATLPFLFLSSCRHPVREPLPADPCFPVGEWTATESGCISLSFKEDGSFVFSNHAQNPAILEQRGHYTFKDGKLSTHYSMYENDVLVKKGNDEYSVAFDDNTGKLVIRGDGRLACDFKRSDRRCTCISTYLLGLLVGFWAFFMR